MPLAVSRSPPGVVGVGAVGVGSAPGGGVAGSDARKTDRYRSSIGFQWSLGSPAARFFARSVVIDAIALRHDANSIAPGLTTTITAEPRATLWRVPAKASTERKRRRTKSTRARRSHPSA